MSYAFPLLDTATNQLNQYTNQLYTDYNRKEDQKIYEQNAKLAYGYSKKSAQDSSTAMLTGMKNAGISPATMTGGMSAFPLSSGHAPSTSAPQADNIPTSQSLVKGAEVKNLLAQNENLQSQNDLIKAQKGKTEAETTAIGIQNQRLQDENDEYTRLSGQTYGAIKAITDHTAQRTSHQRNTLEYMEGEIKAEVLKAYKSDKSNIENEVLHRINNNSKALYELSILSQTFENLKEDKNIKEETVKNLKKQSEKLIQEIGFTKEQAERLKSLNVKKMIDEGDYLGALLSFALQLSTQVSFGMSKTSK